jgi:hypothetical protein
MATNTVLLQALAQINASGDQEETITLLALEKATGDQALGNLLAKIDLKASAGPYKVSVIDKHLESAGITGQRAFTEKLRLIKAGLLLR